jgi:hypothetical protein
MALAGSLAVCQLVTLAILWPRPTPTVDSALGPLAGRLSTPESAGDNMLTSRSLADESDLWSLNRRMLLSPDAELPPLRNPTGPMVPSDPPLHAYSSGTHVGLD